MFPLDSARLEAASVALGVPRSEAVPEILTGQRGGLSVSFGANAVGWSIYVELAAPIPDVLLKILPTESVSPEDIDEGMTVDVTTGDAAFDQQFHVEGAPSDVVRAVLDDRIRGWMLAHPRSTLDLLGAARVRVIVEELEPERIASAIDEIVAFATAVPTRARQAVTSRDADASRVTGYRAVPDRDSAHAAHVVGQVEVARLREERQIAEGRVSRWLLASLVMAAVPMFWLLPLWIAAPLLLPGVFVAGIVLGLVGLAADYLGRARLRRWSNRRRRARFERRFTQQLPPGDF